MRLYTRDMELGMGMEIGGVEYRKECVGLEVYIWDWQFSMCCMYIPLISEMLGFPNLVMTIFHLRVLSATSEQIYDHSF